MTCVGNSLVVSSGRAVVGLSRLEKRSWNRENTVFRKGKIIEQDRMIEMLNKQ